TGFALNILIIHALGDVISPMVIGAVADRTGSMNVAFLVVSAFILLAGVFWLWGARYLKSDTDKVLGAAAPNQDTTANPPAASSADKPADGSCGCLGQDRDAPEKK